ncbi:MAG TPA: class I SAM-dependent methyltransferase [Solirubrobacteraceae bacterium]|nr:class I SAM-dependent methyltransferase [Solirubrobacteraceae bacterium]
MTSEFTSADGPVASHQVPAPGPSAGADDPSGSVPTIVDRGASLTSRATLAISRALWSSRADSWAEQGSQPLSAVVAAVVEEAAPRPGAVVLDMGCGSGQVSFPLARLGAKVLAVDIDAESIALMQRRAAEAGIDTVTGAVHPLETLDLAHHSLDLIVSNYAMHHLRDADKQVVLERARLWLRPGGRLVIGDMMFGRGAAAGDREIIASKVRSLATRGPAGWWRILKNAVRFLLRFQEKPLRPERWSEMISAAGFEHVVTRHVVAEAHVVSATTPLA